VDPATEELADAIVAAALRRIRMEPPPLDGSRPASELREETGETITEEGIGGERALELFEDVLARACTTFSHPRNFLGVPSAPTHEAVLFDLVTSAHSIQGGAWLAGAGAIFAENQVIDWLAGLTGFPETAAGTFVQGGTLGILSALVAARARAQADQEGGPAPARIATSADAHFATAEAASVMGCELLALPVDADRRLTASALEQALDGPEGEGLFAVVASAGSTLCGAVDDLAGLGRVCRERGIWLHIDGSYGLPAILVESTRPLFDGIELADSFVVNPHKWLFAPYDASALVYRDGADATRAHAWSAPFLEVLQPPSEAAGESFDPKHYAIHLSRRARGLPLWFSLAAHGTKAIAAGVESCIEVTRAAAERIRDSERLELFTEPALSVLVFRRRGWGMQDYVALHHRLREAELAVFAPTEIEGEALARLCVINPATTLADVEVVLDAMA
jgi:glutamate/tyrosine decarboxylase-like PLP-dependent enzyme